MGTRAILAGRRAVVLAASAMLLTACATGVSDIGTSRGCPSLVNYSPEFRKQAVREIEQLRLSEDSAIARMLRHYARMRDQTRRCAGTRAGS